MTPKHPPSQLFTILFAMEQTKQLTIHINIFTDNLNNTLTISKALLPNITTPTNYS